MSWKLRHQGSPRAIENLTLAQVVEGLQDGQWEATDEVMGPGDRSWIAIEDHPQLAEIVLEAVPPPTSTLDPEEERLDMNPLIDVCLVLLVFFILTTTYQTLEKVLDMPRTKAAKVSNIKKVTPAQVKQFMIVVQAKQLDGKLVVTVDNEKLTDTSQESFKNKLLERIGKTQKTELLIDASGVPWGLIVRIIDAAGGTQSITGKKVKIHFRKDPSGTG